MAGLTGLPSAVVQSSFNVCYATGHNTDMHFTVTFFPNTAEFEKTLKISVFWRRPSGRKRIFYEPGLAKPTTKMITLDKLGPYTYFIFTLEVVYHFLYSRVKLFMIYSILSITK